MVNRDFSHRCAVVLFCCCWVLLILPECHAPVISPDTSWMSNDVNGFEPPLEALPGIGCQQASLTLVSRVSDLAIEWSDGAHQQDDRAIVKHFYNISWYDRNEGRVIRQGGGILKLQTFRLPTQNKCEIIELSVCRRDWQSQTCACGIWTPATKALRSIRVLKGIGGVYSVSWESDPCVTEYVLEPGSIVLTSTHPVVRVYDATECNWNQLVVRGETQNGATWQELVEFHAYPQRLLWPGCVMANSVAIRAIPESVYESPLELTVDRYREADEQSAACFVPTAQDYAVACGVASSRLRHHAAAAVPSADPMFCPVFRSTATDPLSIGPVRDLRANTDLDRTVILTWREPDDADDCVKEYQVSWGSEMVVLAPDKTSYFVRNLEPCVSYNFTVAAVDLTNDRGVPNTIEATVREIEQLSEVVELELNEVDPRSLSAKWKPPVNGTNCVKSYRVAAWYTSPEDASDEVVFSNTTTDQHVTFGEVIACMTYMVQVIPISFLNKDGRNEIAPLKTKERTILPYHVEPIRAVVVKPRSLELSTHLHADNNNNCLLVSVRFNCTIVTDGEADPESQVVKEYRIPDGNASFEGLVEPLVPYSVYQCNAQILNIAGWSDATPSYDIQTAEDVPEIPRDLRLRGGNGSVDITWKAPAVKNGIVVRYRIHIRMIGPEYPLPKACDELEEYNETVDLRDEIEPGDTRSWDGVDFQYTVTRLAPYTEYTVQVAAATGAGVGPYSDASSVVTRPGAPELARNFRIESILGPELNKPYQSSVEFSWEVPCRLNGQLRRFEGLLYGVRGHNISATHSLAWSVTVEEGDDLLEPFRYIENRLLPEYDYMVSLYLFVADVDEPSAETMLTFESPAGIPTIDPTEEWFKVDVFDAPNPTNTARILLGSISLTSDIGSIRYVALLVSERICQSDPQPRTDFINVAGESQWPEVPDWHRVYNMRCTEQYQTTPKFWNPMQRLVRGETSAVEFVVGEERCDTGKEYCNGPLKPGTDYALVVRIFSRTGYTDSNLQFFRTDSLILVGLITGSIVACCVLAFVSGLVILWRRQRLLSPAQLAGRTPSEEPSDIPLKNFPNQYDELFQSNREKVSKEFQAINYFADTVLQETVSQQSARENERKNRYVNILPFDSNRVQLDGHDEVEGDANDYINASYIEGYKYQREYIATQGPKQDTCYDFWRMVLQCEIESIVMLTQPIDHDKNKCCQYYPRFLQSICFRDIRIKCQQEMNLGLYQRRLFLVSQGNLTKVVFHYHYLDWPDHSCPASPTDLIKFTKIVRAERKSYALPLVVHCSAGVGRTGTFIALDILLQRMLQEKKINVYDTVKQLRRQRVKMVQTLDQYTFLYQCCLEYVTKSNRKKPKTSYIEMMRRDGDGGGGGTGGDGKQNMPTVIEVDQPGTISNGGKPLFKIKFPKSVNPGLNPGGLEKVTSFAPTDIGGSDP
ncbi:tyrosine-protein phosphatase 10D [Anopheles cruzii]|uniref:tyrosine-protein phosphatase 10D n=1 Tax=Anopheles cruzii TaxID=68878 RepID=UPI0022EC247D|nr:tyrosine-protein phosphatase 10D [Anopheles cruzii]